MKIGLIGAPGSGKSKFGWALKEAIEAKDNGCVECVTPWPITIVDDYVQQAERQSRLALGFHATYVGNLHVALERAAAERTAAEGYKTIITCGTLIETSAYLVMDFESTLRLDGEDQREDTLKRAEASMKILSCLFADTFRYDHLFYLNGFTDTTEDLATLDRNLQASFSVFPLVEVVPLIENQFEDKVSSAMGYIFGGEDESNAARQGTSTQAPE